MPLVVLIAAVVVTVLAVLQFAGRIRASGVEFTVGLALSLWPPAKSILVPPSEFMCRCIEELRGFFEHPDAANLNMARSGKI